MTNFKCPICGNEDKKMIGYLNGIPYCRKCISFKGEEAEKNEIYPKRADFSLNYDLSDDQNRLSDKLIDNYKNGINSLVHAVCGSGKTEIVLSVIKYAIQCGDRVGFAVPRRDVCIELHQRFSSIFKKNKVSLVYGGNTNELTGDLICLTTHQLFRYKEFFDLLIIDEVDAFPFKNNDLLNSFFEQSVKGKYIMMSATPDNQLISKFERKGMDILQLNTRFHGYPLPVPYFIKTFEFLLYFELFKCLNKFRKLDKQVFVFTPTIDICETTYYFLKLFFKRIDYVHSKKENRTETIEKFRNKETNVLITTAVLERGVTVKDLQVIVFKSDHKIYDQYSLVQIAGRVGRKKDAPTGEVVFIAKSITESMENARSDIISSNQDLQKLF